MKKFFKFASILSLGLLLTGCVVLSDEDERSSNSSSQSISNSETTDSSSGSETSNSTDSSESNSDSTSTTNSSTSIPEGAIDATTINSSTTIASLVNATVDTTNYYSSITSSMDASTLKTKLNSIINGSKSMSYNYLEDYMRDCDRDWHRSPDVNDENPYMILLYYTSNDVTEKQQLWNHYHTREDKFGVPTAQQSWDKEHIWAKSNGSLSGDAYSDLHHLRASDMKNNNTRSNFPLANVTSGGTYIKDFAGNNASKKGTAKGVTVVEPLDQYTGDVARALLYMTIRYTSLSLTTGTDSSGGKWGFLDDLLAWNLADQPDEFEIRRNSLVQKYQGNRNPFIDHPEYACRLHPSSSSCK